jgi:hypothetical protein
MVLVLVVSFCSSGSFGFAKLFEEPHFKELNFFSIWQWRQTPR